MERLLSFFKALWHSKWRTSRKKNGSPELPKHGDFVVFSWDFKNGFPLSLTQQCFRDSFAEFGTSLMPSTGRKSG